MRLLGRHVVLLYLACAGGCMALARGDGHSSSRLGQAGAKDRPEKKSETEVGAAKDGSGAGNGSKKPPSVLLNWNFGRTAAKIEEEEDEEREPPLAADRPDFVEASVNVGAGRVQLEMGYTLIRDRHDGVSTQRHSYPEALLRVGLWVDWLELRVGQNLGTETTRSNTQRTRHRGAEDLYLGLGVGLTEQKGVFPESRVNLQARVPTGCAAFNDKHFLPGMNYLYGWEVIEDRLSVGASTAWNRKRDDTEQTYIEFSQAVTTALALTDKLGMYLESFALFPIGAAVAMPEYYADGGFTYRVTPNWQLDLRAGVGLNRHADDFFTGAGMVMRY